MATNIEFTEMVGEKTLEDGGYIGDLLELTLVHLEKAKEEGQLTASQVGELYATTIPVAIRQGISYGMQVRSAEFSTDKIEAEAGSAIIAKEVAEATKPHKVNTSLVNDAIVTATKDSKVNTAGSQATKAANDAGYVATQDTALREQVVDNRRVKTLDSLSDTYGTAMAGGLKVTTEMWTAYFEIAKALAEKGSLSMTDPGDSTVVTVAT